VIDKASRYPVDRIVSMAAVCLPPSPKAAATDAVLEMTAAVTDLLQQQQQQKRGGVVALDDCPISSRGKKSYRSHIQLPEIKHTNLASFILENAGSDDFSSRTAIVDGATGTHYTYSKVSQSFILPKIHGKPI
jgi:hypothetical protein